MAASGQTYEQLDTAFRHRNFKPLYFIYGDERFLMDELQRQLIANSLEEHERAFNLDIVYGNDTDAPSVLALCASYPVMAERRVVIVREFDQLKESQRFAAYAEHPNPTAIVLLLCGKKPNLSAHPYRGLKAHAEWAEIKPLYDNQMPGWLQKQVQARGYTITPEAVHMLADYIGVNLQAAVVEIDKLITYAGDRKAITGDDVVRASGQTREFNVFELQRAIGEYRYSDALRTAERLLRQASNQRGEALMIVSVLTSYFTKLWKLHGIQGRGITDKEIAARVGISPYFIKEYQQVIRHFNRYAVERAFASLLAADYELKGGSGRDERLVLALLMRRLAQRPAEA
ncbi:MAG: DNA polymerase III subunit delta [Rhodothermales bacterium]